MNWSTNGTGGEQRAPGNCHLDHCSQKRLAAMQADAFELETERKTRLAELDAKDAQKRLEDDKSRSARGKFIGGIREQAVSVDSSRRLQGGRGRDED